MYERCVKLEAVHDLLNGPFLPRGFTQGSTVSNFCERMVLDRVEVTEASGVTGEIPHISLAWTKHLEVTETANEFTVSEISVVQVVTHLTTSDADSPTFMIRSNEGDSGSEAFRAPLSPRATGEQTLTCAESMPPVL